MPFLVLDTIAKSFGDVEVLRDLSLEVAQGEVMALLGLSGSGKTTALRLVAGFETPDAGRISVAGEDVTRLPPAARGFGMVFQHYALFPHMTVAENVAFGLEARGRSREEIAARVAEMLALVDLTGFGARRIGAISGGQQQRVALARALAPEPRVLLLDEPLSNLDPSLRERTRRELRAAVRQVGITTLLVTHEQEEAFDVGDRVAVLDGGRLEQVGTPRELYDEPMSRFVATFVGRAALLPARLLDAAGRARLEGVPDAEWPAVAVGELEAGDAVDLAVRPEGLVLASEATAGAVAGTVTGHRFTGPLTYALIRLPNDAEVEVLLDDRRDGSLVEVGATVTVAPRPGGPPPRAFARAATAKAGG